MGHITHTECHTCFCCRCMPIIHLLITHWAPMEAIYKELGRKFPSNKCSNCRYVYMDLMMAWMACTETNYDNNGCDPNYLIPCNSLSCQDRAFNLFYGILDGWCWCVLNRAYFGKILNSGFVAIYDTDSKLILYSNLVKCPNLVVVGSVWHFPQNTTKMHRALF